MNEEGNLVHAPDTSVQRPYWPQLLLLFVWELRVQEDSPKLYSIPVWGNAILSSSPWPNGPNTQSYLV